jgi:hypothetical protein
MRTVFCQEEDASAMLGPSATIPIPNLVGKDSVMGWIGRVGIFYLNSEGPYSRRRGWVEKCRCRVLELKVPRVRKRMDKGGGRSEQYLSFVGKKWFSSFANCNKSPTAFSIVGAR